VSGTTSVAPARARAKAPRSGGTTTWKLQRTERLAGYGFVLPITVLFAIFVGYPILFAIYLSFTRWSGFGTPQFTGVANYTRMFSDPVAAGAFFNTILFIPGIISFVVSGVLWKLIYDPNLGTLNNALKAIGLGDFTQHWLSDPALVMPSIIVVSVWAAIGMNMLIFFAGIQGVDPTYYEAAEVDGASRWQQFWYVTVPGLRVVTAIVISLNLMNGFKVFDIIYVMTGGGPSHQSEVFGTYLYGLAFGSTAGSIPQLGYGSAFSVIVMLLCGVAVLVQITLTRRANR
jgi:ABC-type sugar transport system permease subunit